MKIALDKDEWWPVYSAKGPGDEFWDIYEDDADVEVDEETLARWQAVFAAFREVQDELEALYEAYARRRRSP